jgi:hypothetical protein
LGVFGELGELGVFGEFGVLGVFGVFAVGGVTADTGVFAVGAVLAVGAVFAVSAVLAWGANWSEPVRLGAPATATAANPDDSGCWAKACAAPDSAVRPRAPVTTQAAVLVWSFMTGSFRWLLA